jgi:hypothetical protein
MLQLMPLALSVSAEVKSLGEYAGFAAIIGLALLAALYFAQARELKRLSEWAAREAARPRLAPQPQPPPPQQLQPHPAAAPPPPALPTAVTIPPASAPAVVPGAPPVPAGPIVAAPGVRRIKIPTAGDAARIAPSTAAAAQAADAPDAGQPAVPLAASPAPSRVVASGDPPAGEDEAPGPRFPPAPPDAGPPGNAPVAASAPIDPALASPLTAVTPPTTPRRPRRPGQRAGDAAPDPYDEPPSRRRGGGGSRLPRSWPRYAAVLAVLVIAAVVIVLHSSGSSTPGSSATGNGPAPASVTVAVLNATTHKGLAQTVAAQLSRAGFKTGVVANATALEPKTVVGYDTGDNSAAYEVEHVLGLTGDVNQVSVAALSTASGTGTKPQVVVTLGANYQQ